MPEETDFDQMISSHDQELLKAALPFFPYSEQKVLSLFIRINELLKTIELFANESPPMRICTNEQDSSQSLELMIQTLKDYCTPSEAETLDLFFNIQQALLLSEESLNPNKENPKDSSFQLKDLLYKFLSPEQVETLQILEILQQSSSNQ
jgi:hypothetical protein